MHRKKYFNPPYESPLEEKFAELIRPMLKKSVRFIPQFEAETLWGKFRIDFVLQYRDEKAGIECDGETVHGTDAQIYDNWRDIICLSEKVINRIYRFSGSGLFEHMHEAIKLFTSIEQNLFREKVLSVIEKDLNGKKYHDLSAEKKDSNNFVLDMEFAKTEENALQKKQQLKIKKLSELDEEHKKIYKYLQAYPGKRINPLIYRYLKQMRD